MKKSGIMNGMVDTLGSFATKINSYRYIMVIKNAFAALIPVIITGAFATLFSAMIFDDVNGLAQVKSLSFLATLKPIAVSVNYVTLSFLTIYAVFLIGIELAKLNGISSFFPGIVAVMAYLSVNPMTFEVISDDISVVAENVLAKQYTDTKGLFLGMFVAIASIELYSWLGRQDNLKIKMPDTVPSNVANSFSALIPTILTVTGIATIGFIIKAMTGMYAYDIIYNIIQKPLESLIDRLHH